METEDPFSATLTLTNILVNPPDTSVITGLAVLVLLLVCSAFISGSEVAFFSLSPADRNNLKSKRSKRASGADSLLEKPERLLSTILIANNFVNVGIIMLAAYISNLTFEFTSNPILGFLLEVVIITFILLLFGEILPKVYATRHNLGFALVMALPLTICEKLFRPLSAILEKSSSLVQRRAGQIDHSISKGELSEAISLASGEDKEEEKILKGIVKFGNIDAKEIMRPRIDVIAIDIKTPFMEVIPSIIDSGYSRIPVFNGSFDQVQGILYIKDLLPHFHKGNSFNWQSLIRPPYFIPETKKINDLLEEFQTKKIHLAIVIDEYGGTSGIITLEDILEEIVGDIPDESEEGEIQFEKIEDNIYIFEGKTQLNDFFKVIDIDFDPFENVRGESDTLAGLILELIGEIPDSGFTTESGRFRFRIESADKRRIKKIRVEILGENDSKNDHKN